jgi:SAM-dependent methyltransferase
VFDKPEYPTTNTKLEYVRGDIDENELPMADESFDAVILNNVIEHMYHPLHLLSESRRILRKNGILVITTPNQANLKNRMKLMLGGSIYYPLRLWLGEGDEHIRKMGKMHFAGHIREYTANEIRVMVEMARLELISLKMLQTARPSAREQDKVPRKKIECIETLSRSPLVFLAYIAAEKILSSARYMMVVVARRN